MERDTSMEYSLYQLASGISVNAEATSNAISTLAELVRRGNKRAHKYLEKLEILEIPFVYKNRRFLLPFLSKKVKNDYVFRAVFYFSQTPKKGKLDVEFI